MTRFRPQIRSNRTDATKGMAGVVRNYERLVKHLTGATPQVLLNALGPTFELSQEYCPKDTGNLVESGYLEVTVSRGAPRVEMGYGKGGKPKYAVRVHENLEWRHKRPTRAKWLQAALEEDSGELPRRLEVEYKKIMR